MIPVDVNTTRVATVIAIMDTKRGLDTRVYYDADGLPAGVESTCPFDGRVNRCGFGANGVLVSWPLAEHCRHFRGLYAGGEPALALYR